MSTLTRPARALTLAAALCLAAIPAIADECDYERPLDATLAVEDATAVRIIAEAGWLRVEGREGVAELVAKGTACASRESGLDDVELRAYRRGDTLVVEALTPDSWFGNDYSRLNLEVELPSHLPVDIRDGSGSLEVRGIASLDLEDGSGSIEVFEVAGDVEIEDGSGSIRVDGVGGEVQVHDGSGSIEIENVGKDVEIREDGSGSMTITDVRGSVRVREDGSGSIYVADVTGDFSVERDGSGSIQMDNVQGNVRIP